jgi:haloalkane dehalogenase
VSERAHAAGLAYREARPDGDEAAGTALLLHGWPESSWMWEGTVGPLAEAGWRAVAPDFSGFGDSPPDPPSTWERHVEELDRFHRELDLGPVALVVHDWGGLIGLRWACDHPDAVSALCISNTGFFPDGRWHGFAESFQTEGEGEQLIGQIDRAGFGAMLGQLIPGVDERSIDEYWKAFGDDVRRQGTLELYRSGDFAKLEPYQGKLAALGVPTLILWGENDPFAPMGGAHRFAKEIPGAELVALEGVGHFAPDEAPDRYAAALVEFLS